MAVRPKFVLGWSTVGLRELEISTAQAILCCIPPSSDTTQRFPDAARLPWRSPRFIIRSPSQLSHMNLPAMPFWVNLNQRWRGCKTLRTRFHMVRAAGGHPENVAQLPPLPPTQPRWERPNQRRGCPPASVPRRIRGKNEDDAAAPQR